MKSNIMKPNIIKSNTIKSNILQSNIMKSNITKPNQTKSSPRDLKIKFDCNDLDGQAKETQPNDHEIFVEITSLVIIYI